METHVIKPGFPAPYAFWLLYPIDTSVLYYHEEIIYGSDPKPIENGVLLLGTDFGWGPVWTRTFIKALCSHDNFCIYCNLTVEHFQIFLSVIFSDQCSQTVNLETRIAYKWCDNLLLFMRLSAWIAKVIQHSLIKNLTRVYKASPNGHLAGWCLSICAGFIYFCRKRNIQTHLC